MNKHLPMLEGYRVLDFTQVVAGPTCTRILAEMGAEVIKVELAPFGDRTRVAGLRPRQPEFQGASQSTYFFQHNHSKKSLALDFKTPQGKALLLKMLPKCDVVVENFSPGVMARAGLSYDDLRQVNPQLIMCSVSLAGQAGPLSNAPGYDFNAQAYAGITDLIGDPEQTPSLITMAIGDISTGVSAAMAIGFALLHREKTGRGQYIEASLLDTYFHMHEVAVPRVSLRKGYTPRRTGSQHPDGGPTGVFRCADGRYITLATLPHQWTQFTEAIQRPDLLSDPRFSTASLRRDNNAAIKEILEDWLAAFGSREQAIETLKRHRIPCAPVLTLNEAMEHPHLKERGTVRRVSDAMLGDFDVPGMPVRFSDWPGDRVLRADLLGEHNDEVLKSLLDMTDSEIAKLYQEKILVRDPFAEHASA